MAARHFDNQGGQGFDPAASPARDDSFPVPPRRVVHVLTVPLSLRFLRGQCRHLRERGYEVHVVCSAGPELDAFAREEGAHVHTLRLGRRITPIRDVQNLIGLIALLRRLRPSVVHGHTPKAGLLASIAGFIADVPVRVYSLRGLPLETAKGSKLRLLTATERVACACSGDVIAVSHSLMREALARGLCPPSKMRVLCSGSSGGVDAVRFDRTRLGPATLSSLRSQLGILPEAPIVGFVGRLTKDKGLVRLMEAWATLRVRVPDARLLIVGSEDGTDPLPHDCLEAIKVDPRVCRVPFTESIEPLYGLMDVLVLLSEREGFPNVVLEAAAMCVPAVVLRATGSMDAVVDGKTGRIVDREDRSGLVEALAGYLENPDLRVSHGRNARARVEADFRQMPIWEAITARYDYLRKRPRQRGLRRAIKRSLDVVLGVALLAGTAPLHALAALVLLAVQGRPVLFTQPRVGYQGRVFLLRKLRTMSNARGPDGALLPDEARLGRVGAVIRSLSLDELPQLWNVLLGDMSLVGPRPLLPEYLPRYTPEQARRHDVMPGLTGWAVVNGRNSTSWAERLALDTWYVDHWSLALDLEILLRTASTVLLRRGVSNPGHVTMPAFMGT